MTNVIEIVSPIQRALETLFGKRYVKRVKDFGQKENIPFLELLDIHCDFFDNGLREEVLPYLREIKKDADSCNVPFREAIETYLSLWDIELVNPYVNKSLKTVTANDNIISPRELTTGSSTLGKVGDFGIKKDPRVSGRGNKKPRKTATTLQREENTDTELQAPPSS